MRETKFASNKYYYLHGNNEELHNLFADDEDKARFLFLILYLQSPILINNTSFYINSFLRKEAFRIGKKKLKDIEKNRYVEVVSFCIAENSFHILIKNLKEDIASVYMHRILTSYSRYFNSKHKRNGHVFSGPFKAVRIGGNDELPNASVYIHKGVFGDKNFDYRKYRWSSFTDFIRENRWGNLLQINAVSKLFKNKSSYDGFVSNKKAIAP
jgi:REP element-mobilizing transposase RayT